jgi:hypothetical protein
MTTPAPLTHEDASAQLLDLVYGEAEGAAKAALEAHVAGCAQCQAELAALGDTRALLRGTLTEEPPVPARAHAKILEAARAAVAAPAQAAAPAKAKGAQPSFWERMRGRWTFPTLATVGAVAVVVVTSKMFLDPNTAFEKMEAQRAPAEAELQAPPPAAAPVARGEAPAQEPPAAAPAEQAPPADTVELQRRRRALEKLRIGQLSSRGAERAHSVDERLRAAMDRFDGAGHGLGGGSTATGGGLGGLGAGVKRDELAKSVRANAAEKAAEPATKPAPAPVAAKPAAAPARSYASPPAGWAAEGKASQPSAPKGGAAAGAVAPAPASPPAVAVEAAPAKRKAVMDDLREADEESKAESVAEDKAAKKESRQKDAAPSADALVRKAEQLYAAGRWGEAITAYRELLRRFPEAEAVGQWRTRLVQAQREETAVREKAATKAAPAAH